MAHSRLLQILCTLVALPLLAQAAPLDGVTNIQERESDFVGPVEAPDGGLFIHDSFDNSTTKIDIRDIDIRDAKKFLALWTESSISTVDAGGGNQYVHDAGFSITNHANKVIYEKAYPGGYSACTVGGGREFTLGGGCFGTHKFKFRCTTTGVHPSHCQVRKGNGQVLKTNKGDYDYGFYGVYATAGGSCGCGFPVPDDFVCPPKQSFKYSNRHMVGNKDWHNDKP